LPSFANWDFSLPKANDHAVAVIQAFEEAVLMAALIHLKADARYPTIIDHYFNPDDIQNVEQVFANIVGATKEHPDGNPDGTGSGYFSGITLTNHDSDDPGDPCGKNQGILAWLGNAKDGSHNALMRVCDELLDLPTLGIPCGELGPTVSGKMTSLAGIVLHEMTYVASTTFT
jgi:hypothetical protein